MPRSESGELPGVPGAVLRDPASKRETHRAGRPPLSQWLFSRLVAAERPAVCTRTRRARALLHTRINKNDRNEARAIAQMMRVNFAGEDVRQSASADPADGPQAAQGEVLAIENNVRGLLFWPKVGPVGAAKFDARLRERVAGLPERGELAAALLGATSSCASSLAHGAAEKAAEACP